METGRGGCPNPVLGYRFRLASGDLVPMPCNRSSCTWCSRRAGMITAVMIGLDAANEQPWVCSTFTTRDRMTPTGFRDAQDRVRKLVRSEVGPHVRSCSFLEFTTGRGERSGGVRRPHLHTLWKGIGAEAAPIVAGCAGYVLEKAAGAWRHQVDEIETPAGATMYVARHHLKESQAPPASWGPTRRVRPSRGYYSEPAEELRTRAKAIVREKRIERRIWREVEEAEEESGRDFTDVGVELLDRALAAPPPEVVRVCNPWEDFGAA